MSKPDLAHGPVAPASERPIDSRFLAVLDSAHIAVMAVDAACRPVYENQSAARLLGHEGAQRSWRHLSEVVAAGTAEVRAEIRKLVAERHWRGGVTMRHKRGNTVAVEGSALATRGLDGSAVYVGFMRPLEAPPQNAPAEGFFDTAPNAYALTTREMIVLQLMAEGLADKEIARLLGISVWTASKDASSVLNKLGAASRTRASVQAVREGLA
jgi:DNA-binding CsgD family transcriptional regulator